MEGINPFGPELLVGTSTFAATPVERFTTPPPLALPDPETPRSEAGKRMAKDADAWIPLAREVLDYLWRRKICPACWKRGHLAKWCTTLERSFGGIDG